MPLIGEFGWSRAVTSGAASLCWLLSGFISIVAGTLSDRLGPRRVMTGCGFFFGLAYLLLSQVTSIWQLYLYYSLIIAVGMSAADVVPLSTLSRWFAKKRGAMTGITKVGTGAGMMAIPLVASRLVTGYGWRTAYTVLGAGALIALVSVAQLFKRDPAQTGQFADGEEKGDVGRFNLVEAGLSLREAIHLRQLWMVCAAYLCVTFCVQTLMVHIVPHAEDIGISPANAANVLSTIGGVSIAGRLVMGKLGDKIGHERAMAICFLPMLGALFWLQMAKDLWMLYLFAAIYGFGHGGFFALISPLMAQLFGTKSQGAIFGIAIAVGAIGGAIGPLLAGHIFDLTGSYRIPFLIVAGLIAIALILIMSLGSPSRKGKANGVVSRV
jgi:MFS family permease